jgi:hypothetical protein
MKQLKRVAIAALATIALTALAGAPSASATTLSVGGVTVNAAVTLHATIRAGDTTLLADTFRIASNTCSESTVHSETETVFTGAAIGGNVRALTFTRCTNEGRNREGVVVHRAGRLNVQWINGTTNGTVFSTGTEVTWPLGGAVSTCTTNNTDIGTLTGVRRGGVARITINTTLTCSGVGTAIWTGTYTLTGATTELGVEQ